MIFGMDSRDEDNKKVIQETFLEKTWRQESDLSSWVHTQNLAAMLSLNYQFNEQHSLGMRYNYDYTPNNRWHIPPLPTTVTVMTNGLRKAAVPDGRTAWRRDMTSTCTITDR